MIIYGLKSTTLGFDCIEKFIESIIFLCYYNYSKEI